jgi:hypothetical protein
MVVVIVKVKPLKKKMMISSHIIHLDPMTMPAREEITLPKKNLT